MITKRIIVPVLLNFSINEDYEVETSSEIPSSEGVPYSMILENLNNLTKGLASIILKEAYGDVPEDKVEDYLDAIIATDRLKLNHLLKS